MNDINEGDIAILNGDTLSGFVCKIVKIDWDHQEVHLIPVDEPDCTPGIYSVDDISPAPKVGEFVQVQAGQLEGVDCVVVQVDVPLGQADVVPRHGDSGVHTLGWENLVVFEDEPDLACIEQERYRVNEPSVKDTNPKDGIGLTKAAMSCVPLPAIYESALAMMEGALKYGRHNYRVAGVRYSVYFDAMQRHITSWFEGEDRAEDSGVHHLGHAMACCAILLDDQLRDEPIGNDDRPPEAHKGFIAEFNRRVAELKQKHPNPKAPYTR